MTPRDRLKTIRTAIGITQKSFAKGIFISTSYYAGIEAGHRQVNERIIDLVSTRFNVNKDWILTGKGDMFSENPPDVRLQELIDIYKRLNGHFQGYILEQIRALDKIQETKPQREG